MLNQLNYRNTIMFSASNLVSVFTFVCTCALFFRLNTLFVSAFDAWGLRQTFYFVLHGDIIILINTLCFFYSLVDTVCLKRFPTLSFVTLQTDVNMR